LRELLVGFDAAWTARGTGAIVAVLRTRSGEVEELGPPRLVSYADAIHQLERWQAEHRPASTLVMLDQPTIVNNASSWRTVEAIVSSPIASHGGAMQPANTSRVDMFGEGAPVWAFLQRWGGAAWPSAEHLGSARVYETYPALSLIALGRTRTGPTGRPRLPKYNPQRAKTFSRDDWRHVTSELAGEFSTRGLVGLAAWADGLTRLGKPHKHDQDELDSGLCLEVALRWADDEACLVIGERDSGFLVVPHDPRLQSLLEARCLKLELEPSAWVRVCRRGACAPPEARRSGVAIDARADSAFGVVSPDADEA
jgi:predicted RNase H-like nuclease